MKLIQYERFGDPAEVLTCVEAPDPPPPGPGEVALTLLAMPIHPADLLQVRDLYGERPALPATPGFEGIARVAALGEGVSTVAVGDVVSLLAGPTWVSAMTCPAKGLMVLPPDIDLRQAALIRANPCTAWAMLHIVAPEKGQRLIQNAANSSVGRLVAQLAAQRGIETVNIVRRAEAGAGLGDLPGAQLLVADPADAEAITAAGPCAAAFDAVGGEATAALGSALAEGGQVLSYGLLSGEAPRLTPRDVIFRDVRLRGFWLRRWAMAAGRETFKQMTSELVALVCDGSLHVAVEAVYALENISQAVSHAARPARTGKILLSPDPALLDQPP